MKSKTYDEFVEKFKPKLTTDDCMTPPLVYKVVKDWVCSQYGVNEKDIVRPFWPGADYTTFDYPEGCVVVDNPPFSILSKICEYYLDHKIPFFLFAPSLTALNGKKVTEKMNHIICDASIVYENGAVVRTAFVTSFGGDVVIQTAPELGRRLKKANEEIKKEKTKELPKYEYPDHVLTAAMMQRYSKYGIDFAVKRSECAFTSKLDNQVEHGKTIFGGGLLLSDNKAAEKAAAEKAAAHKWELSEREWEIVKGLG